MPQPKKGRGRRAVAEQNGKPTTIEWQGIEIALPSKIPGTLLFDYEGLDTNTGAMAFLRSLLGDDQYAVVREKVASEGFDLAEAERALLNGDESLFSKVAGAIGASAGESQASAGS